MTLLLTCPFIYNCIIKLKLCNIENNFVEPVELKKKQRKSKTNECKNEKITIQHITKQQKTIQKLMQNVQFHKTNGGF